MPYEKLETNKIKDHLVKPGKKQQRPYEKKTYKKPEKYNKLWRNEKPKKKNCHKKTKKIKGQYEKPKKKQCLKKKPALRKNLNKLKGHIKSLKKPNG